MVDHDERDCRVWHEGRDLDACSNDQRHDFPVVNRRLGESRLRGNLADQPDCCLLVPQDGLGIRDNPACIRPEGAAFKLVVFDGALC
jgi:hypothetical protein